MTVGVLAEGFAIPGQSEPEVDETARAAIAVLASAGATARPVSIPWHRDAMHVWTVIATDGVVAQMIDGNGLGMNWPGRYDPDLIGHYARGRREHADALPGTVKMTMFCGRYTLDRYHGRHYAMARNLALELTAPTTPRWPTPTCSCCPRCPSWPRTSLRPAPAGKRASRPPPG
jgi:amidase